MISEGSEESEGLSISNRYVSQSVSESVSIIRPRDASASKNTISTTHSGTKGRVFLDTLYMCPIMNKEPVKRTNRHVKIDIGLAPQPGQNT